MCIQMVIPVERVEKGMPLDIMKSEENLENGQGKQKKRRVIFLFLFFLLYGFVRLYKVFLKILYLNDKFIY